MIYKSGILGHSSHCATGQLVPLITCTKESRGRKRKGGGRVSTVPIIVIIGRMGFGKLPTEERGCEWDEEPATLEAIDHNFNIR